jgi:hypothetical protein
MRTRSLVPSSQYRLQKLKVHFSSACLSSKTRFEPEVDKPSQSRQKTKSRLL